jgi:hypothetical protein
MTTQIFKKRITDSRASGVQVMHRKRKSLHQELEAAQMIGDGDLAFDIEMEIDEAAE